MSTTGVSSCTRYCWGPVHIHPQSETLSQDLWMMGQSLMGLPGLFEAVASHSDDTAPPQPLTERIIDNFVFGFMGFTTLVAAPLLFGSASFVYVAEKLFDTIDVLHGMRVKVQKFEQSLNEQKEIIDAFGPLLDLPKRVAVVNRKMAEKTEGVKKSTGELSELEKNYPANADLLKKVEKVIADLESKLLAKVSKENISVVEEQNLKVRIEILRKVAEEEAKMKALAVRLHGLMESVGKKAEALQRMESEMTELTQAKEKEIAGLEKDAELLIAQANLMPKTPHVRIQYDIVVV